MKPTKIVNLHLRYSVMDFNNFDECFSELRIALKDRLDNGKNTEKLDIYGSYLHYRDEIEVIIDRIEAETRKSMILSKKTFEALQKDEKPDEELGIESIKNWILITVDMKSFFIFTRIFLDTLARIIRQYYPQGHQLSWRMSKLIKSRKLRKLDSDFAKGLRDKMRWWDDFVETRVEIEHYLGNLRSTLTRDGKFGFDILGLRTRKSWGTDTVESITDYIRKILHNLSEVISYIHDKFQSVNL